MNPPKTYGTRIRVIVNDGYDAFLDSVYALLKNQDDIDVVAVTTHISNVVELAQELNPDLIVLDIGWSIKADTDAIRRLIRKIPGVMVLALGMDTSAIVMNYVLEAGAAGYIRKDLVYEELAPAIRAVVAGCDPIDVCSRATDNKEQHKEIRDLEDPNQGIPDFNSVQDRENIERDSEAE